MYFEICFPAGGEEGILFFFISGMFVFFSKPFVRKKEMKFVLSLPDLLQDTVIPLTSILVLWTINSFFLSPPC